jgi:oxygen-independent coproporphyrinogen-3 oxidase
VDPRDRQEAFTARLGEELEALAPWAAGQPLRTIFIGGGTPSLLRPELWQHLLGRLEQSYDLSLIRRGIPGEGEFTVECNPETVSPALMDILAAGGVTRVSIGAQSFHREHLKTLERWHEPENVGRAVEMARAAGIGRQSVDLIFGIPGQTTDQWRSDLEHARSLGTEHLSCYDLTYEPGTAMTRRLQLGQFTPADEDVEVEMFSATVAMLRSAGLDRYEVSNFARPGCECRHNLAYWRQEQWLAAGPSASAHVGGHRWKNIPRLDDYLNQSDRGLAPITDHEGPDARRALAERIMTGLRLAEGLDADAVLAAAGPESGQRLTRVVTGYRQRGLMMETARPAPLEGQGGGCHDGPLMAGPAPGMRWVLTDAGFLMADGIASDLMAAVRE